AAIPGVGRDQKRFALSAEDGSVSLIEPFGSDANRTRSGFSLSNPPLKHAHTIGGFVLADVVHGIAVACAAEKGEASAGDEAAGRLHRVIDGRQKMPRRSAGIDGVVVQ